MTETALLPSVGEDLDERSNHGSNAERPIVPLAAARRFHLNDEEAEVVAAPSLSDEHVMAAGSALVKLTGAGR